MEEAIEGHAAKRQKLGHACTVWLPELERLKSYTSKQLWQLSKSLVQGKGVTVTGYGMIDARKNVSCLSCKIIKKPQSSGLDAIYEVHRKGSVVSEEEDHCSLLLDDSKHEVLGYSTSCCPHGFDVVLGSHCPLALALLLQFIKEEPKNDATLNEHGPMSMAVVQWYCDFQIHAREPKLPVCPLVPMASPPVLLEGSVPQWLGQRERVKKSSFLLRSRGYNENQVYQYPSFDSESYNVASGEGLNIKSWNDDKEDDWTNTIPSPGVIPGVEADGSEKAAHLQKVTTMLFDQLLTTYDGKARHSWQQRSQVINKVRQLLTCSRPQPHLALSLLARAIGRHLYHCGLTEHLEHLLKVLMALRNTLVCCDLPRWLGWAWEHQLAVWRQQLTQMHLEQPLSTPASCTMAHLLTVLDEAMELSGHGWSYPSLVEAMVGTLEKEQPLTQQGTDEKPSTLRLRLLYLEMVECHEEQLNLAVAVGLWPEAVRKLLSVGGRANLNRAIDYIDHHVEGPGDRLRYMIKLLEAEELGLVERLEVTAGLLMSMRDSMEKQPMTGVAPEGWPRFPEQCCYLWTGCDTADLVGFLRAFMAGAVKVLVQRSSEEQLDDRGGVTSVTPDEPRIAQPLTTTNEEDPPPPVQLPSSLIPDRNLRDFGASNPKLYKEWLAEVEQDVDASLFDWPPSRSADLYLKPIIKKIVADVEGLSDSDPQGLIRDPTVKEEYMKVLPIHPGNQMVKASLAVQCVHAIFQEALVPFHTSGYQGGGDLTGLREILNHPVIQQGAPQVRAQAALEALVITICMTPQAEQYLDFSGLFVALARLLQAIGQMDLAYMAAACAYRNMNKKDLMAGDVWPKSEKQQVVTSTAVLLMEVAITLGPEKEEAALGYIMGGMMRLPGQEPDTGDDSVEDECEAEVSRETQEPKEVVNPLDHLIRCGTCPACLDPGDGEECQLIVSIRNSLAEKGTSPPVDDTPQMEGQGDEDVDDIDTELLLLGGDVDGEVQSRRRKAAEKGKQTALSLEGKRAGSSAAGPSTSGSAEDDPRPGPSHVPFRILDGSHEFRELDGPHEIREHRQNRWSPVWHDFYSDDSSDDGLAFGEDGYFDYVHDPYEPIVYHRPPSIEKWGTKFVLPDTLRAFFAGSNRHVQHLLDLHLDYWRLAQYLKGRGASFRTVQRLFLAGWCVEFAGANKECVDKPEPTWSEWYSNVKVLSMHQVSFFKRGERCVKDDGAPQPPSWQGFPCHSWSAFKAKWPASPRARIPALVAWWNLVCEEEGLARKDTFVLGDQPWKPLYQVIHGTKELWKMGSYQLLTPAWAMWKSGLVQEALDLLSRAVMPKAFRSTLKYSEAQCLEVLLRELCDREIHSKEPVAPAGLLENMAATTVVVAGYPLPACAWKVERVVRGVLGHVQLLINHLLKNPELPMNFPDGTGDDRLAFWLDDILDRCIMRTLTHLPEEEKEAAVRVFVEAVAEVTGEDDPPLHWSLRWHLARQCLRGGLINESSSYMATLVSNTLGEAWGEVQRFLGPEENSEHRQEGLEEWLEQASRGGPNTNGSRSSSRVWECMGDILTWITDQINSRDESTPSGEFDHVVEMVMTKLAHMRGPMLMPLARTLLTKACSCSTPISNDQYVVIVDMFDRCLVPNCGSYADLSCQPAWNSYMYQENLRTLMGNPDLLSHLPPGIRRSLAITYWVRVGNSKAFEQANSMLELCDQLEGKPSPLVCMRLPAPLTTLFEVNLSESHPAQDLPVHASLIRYNFMPHKTHHTMMSWMALQVHLIAGELPKAGQCLMTNPKSPQDSSGALVTLDREDMERCEVLVKLCLQYLPALQGSGWFSALWRCCQERKIEAHRSESGIVFAITPMQLCPQPVPELGINTEVMLLLRMHTQIERIRHALSVEKRSSWPQGLAADTGLPIYQLEAVDPAQVLDLLKTRLSGGSLDEFPELTLPMSHKSVANTVAHAMFLEEQQLAQDIMDYWMIAGAKKEKKLTEVLGSGLWIWLGQLPMLCKAVGGMVKVQASLYPMYVQLRGKANLTPRIERKLFGGLKPTREELVRYLSHNNTLAQLQSLRNQILPWSCAAGGTKIQQAQELANFLIDCVSQEVYSYL